MSDLKLPEGEAVTATNLKLGSGDLVPWGDVGQTKAVFDTFKNKTIHLMDNAGSPEWLEWSSVVSVARGTVKGDTRERTYYTGDGFPKMTYREIAMQGAGPFPTTFRRLGIPAPESACTPLANDLPESLDPELRRVTAGTLFTKKFEIPFVNWTVGGYPGTGTATDEWKRTGIWSTDIVFDLSVGDTMKILEVIDADTVTLGSATGTGAFAATAANDTGAVWYHHTFANEGSDQSAEFIGFRIPDGIQASISNHRLRAGDVIRVTRLDYPQGLLWPLHSGTSYWEQDWTTPAEVVIGNETFYQTVNAVIGADALGETNFASIEGSFYYDVDRLSSNVSVAEDRTYVYTYVSALDEEGPPSSASAVVLALDGDTVELTNFAPPPTDNYDIVKIRLYRTSSTLAGTEYQFVKDFPISDLPNITEAVKQSNLGEIISSTTWDAPPEAMQGITAMPNGMMVGFVGRTIHMCEPYFPHAYPPEYDQAVDYEIVGLAAFGNNIVVLTEGTPYVLSGSHPRNVNIRPYKINQACVSAQSIASNVDKVIYASPDGLVEIGVNGARIVTEPYMLKDEWNVYEPTTMVGEFHDGKYFGFFDGEDNVPQAPASAAISGTLSTEVGIQSGGQTIIITLDGDTWVAAGATFNAQRQNIIDGLLVGTAGSGTGGGGGRQFNQIAGWNAVMRPAILVGEVVRTDNEIVTITLAAQTGYSIHEAEELTVTVPATAVVTLAGDQSDDVYVGTSTVEITPLQDYSSIVLAFSERDAANDVPYAVNSRLDITDWDEYGGVGSFFKRETDINAGAYSPSLDRWLAVGQNSSGATPADVNHFATSDDNGVTWTGRANAYNLFTDTAVGPQAAIWDPNHDTFVVGGNDRSLQASPDGEHWTKVPIDPTVYVHASVREFVLSTASVADHIYGIVATDNFMIRSPDLKLAPVTNTWTAVPITYASSIGSKAVASGNAVIISIGSDNTDMEVCKTVQGAATGASIGTISTYNCRGLTFGNDLWVAISNDFRIITCDSGDEGTIGNWSAPSVTKAAGVNIKGIAYDAGDGVTQGYGYIAFGEITASSLGVIYTSPDAATWTLRYTATRTIDIDAMAVKYPEDKLGDVVPGFAPTYNGDRIPTLIGDSFADYADDPDEFTSTWARAQTNITVEVTDSDAIIRISGVQWGDTNDPTGNEYAQADVTLFNLNEKPDSVRITLTESTATGTATGWLWGTWGSGAELIFGNGQPYGLGDFVDDQFFVPLVGFEYGYQASANIGFMESTWFELDELTESEATLTVTFTFEKEGFNDLSLSYKIRATANAILLSA